MKFIKFVFIILCTILFTGCSIEYNLNIDKEFMNEEIKVIYLNNEENKNSIEELLKTKMAAYYNSISNETAYYSVEDSSDTNNLYLTYSYKYSGNNLRNSNAINRCYYKKNVINNDEIILIETEGAFRCLYDDYSRLIDNAVIKITTDLKVEESNADKIQGNQYIWNIDENNYLDKPIYIKIDKTKKSLFAWIKQFAPPGLIVISAIMIVSIIIFIIKLKGNKANKI